MPTERGQGLKKAGFTLAEVLITLTIIGVIAAITIPNLYSKYQKHTYVVGLKKAYSQLQNVVKMIPLTEGCPAGDYECAGLFQNSGNATDVDGQNFEGDSWHKAAYLFSKHIKTQAFCDGAYRTKQSNCYRPLSAGHGNTTYENNFHHVLVYHPKAGFISKDGMIWAFRGGWSNDSPHSNYVLVDVNGKKGPNLDGRDTFMFIIAPIPKHGIPAGTVIPSGSKLCNKYLYGRQNGNTWCTSGASDGTTKGISTSCTGRVLEEDAMNY